MLTRTRGYPQSGLTPSLPGGPAAGKPCGAHCRCPGLCRGRGHRALRGTGARTGSTRPGLPAGVSFRCRVSEAAVRGPRLGRRNSRTALGLTPDPEPFRPCPSNHLQAQVTAGPRAPRERALPFRPRPCRPVPGGEPTSHARGWRVPPSRPHDPCAPRPPGTGGKGRRVSLRLRGSRRAPPPAPALGRVSPRPLAALPLFLSPGVGPGRRAGRGRDAGPPPGWAGT